VAANSAAFALKAYRVRKDNVIEVQGKCKLRKMVYLGYVLKIKYFERNGYEFRGLVLDLL
jgi:hypothetical protein